ncbi:MAG: hypothetical protein C5B49_08745 [Bdellovibrio sp.]|nr:MAG: hypothetical protein C5B49_08745 [Bdellovibrio sp.]
MVLYVVSITSWIVLIFTWRRLTYLISRRKWKGEIKRFHERDWEIQWRGKCLQFAVPSFKTAFFEVRSLNIFERAWRRLARKKKDADPNKAPREEFQFAFHYETEGGNVEQLLVKDQRILESFRQLNERSRFSIVSSSEELRGTLTLRKQPPRFDFDGPEFKEIIDVLGKLIETQAAIPLPELAGKEIVAWHRVGVLPLSVAAGGAVLGLGWLFMFAGSGMNLNFRIAGGSALFLTGLGVLLSAWKVPPHQFVRVASRYLLLFSWAAFFWVASTLTTFVALFKGQ